MSLRHMVQGIRDFRKDGRPKMVVFGCGRSGTLYMRRYFKCMGMDVGHEGFRRDGISSWYICDNTRSQIVRQVVAGSGAVFIHLVRNPVDVMVSMLRCEALRSRAGFDFYRRAFGEEAIKYESNPAALAARYWIDWNRMAIRNFEFIDLTIQVEAVPHPDNVMSLCQMTGVAYTPKIQDKIAAIPTNSHKFKDKERMALNRLHPALMKDGFREAIVNILMDSEPAIYEELKNMASNYGYRDLRGQA